MPPEEDPTENKKFDPIERAKQADQQQANEDAALFDGGDSKQPHDPTSGSTRNSELNTPFKDATSGNPIGQKQPFNFRTFFTKGRGSLLTALLLLLIGGGGVGLFGGAAAPIAFLEPIVNDLNDQLRALDIRSEAVVRNQIPKSDRDQAIAGCKILSIRCKFRTISSAQEFRLRVAGIKISPAEANWNGRFAPESYEFRGQTYTPREFADAINSRRNIAGDINLRAAFKRANNMKYLGFSDRSFVGKTLGKWGLTKRVELKGNHQDRVNQLLTQAKTDDPKNLKFTPIVEDDPSQGYHLDGDDSGKVYTPDDVESLNKSITEVQTPKAPPSRITSTAVKGLSVLGAVDLACSIKNMIGAASVAAKVANTAEFAKTGFPVMSMISQLKAGDLSVEDTQVLGEYLTSTDNRPLINDLQNSFNKDSPVPGALGLDDEITTIKNPDYGKSGMDNPLYQMSVNGGIAPTQTRYSLGMGQNVVLAGLSGAAEIASTITNLGADNDQVCNVVQNWGVRIGGMIVGLVLAVGSSGSSIAVQAAVFGGLMVASIALQGIISGALGGSAIPEDFGDAPLDRTTVVWDAAAITSGQVSQVRGLTPANAEQIAQYRTDSKQNIDEYIALDREDSGQFDISNPNSFLGSFATKLASFSPPSLSGSSFLKNTSSLLSGSVASILQPVKAQAAGNNVERYQQFDDASYERLGIDADVQGNVRYYMPERQMAMDVDEVAQYMEDSGYVAKNTTTGLPVGYKPMEPEESQGFALDTLNGVVNSFYDSRSSLYQNDYAKFLDFCVNRALPWGETYDEGGALGAVEEDWRTGKKCMENSKMMDSFHVYTFDKTVIEAMNEEEIDESTSTGSDDKQALAQEILAANKVSFIQPLDRKIFQDVAAGTNDGNTFPCGVHISVLNLIADLVRDGHQIQINDMNRGCQNSTAGGLSKPQSRHYAGNGSAIDFGRVDGVATWSPAGFNIMEGYFKKYLVPNSSIGQIACVKTSLPVHRLGDNCNHLHFDFPPDSDPNLQCKANVYFGGCTINAV